MKKIITFISIALLTLQIRGQSSKNLIPNPSDTDAYYMCVTAEASEHRLERQMILKVTHPQWVLEKLDTVPALNLQEGMSVTQTVEIRPATMKWRMGRIKCISVDFTNCIGLRYIYESAKSKTIPFYKGSQAHIIEIEKQSRPASLALIVADAVRFENMQKVELEKSPFTYFKDTIERVVYVVPDSGHSFYWDKDKPDCADPYKAHTVREVQKKLNEKGYDCPVNNLMGQKTKDALVRFQKDHGLPIIYGSPWEILKALFPPPPPSEDDLKLKRLNEW